MIQCWRDHSLSLVLAGIGFVSYAAGIYLAVTTDWVRVSDFLLNLGHGFVPVAAYGWFAGQFVERNKPEEDVGV